jgi:hypothetical protein
MAARFPVGAALRHAGLLFSAALLTGCTGMTDLSNSDTGRIGLLLFHEVTNIGSQESVPRSRVAAVPYASLGVRLGSSDESMFVLAGKAGEDLVWLGGRQLAIRTRNGRIIRTAGFVNNLSGFQVAAGPPENARSGVNYFLYDFSGQSRYGVSVTCITHDFGAERILILGVAHDTRHVGEDCAAPSIDWRFRNEFWRDGSGIVWKSEQNVAPGLDAFTLEILRPAQ